MPNFRWTALQIEIVEPSPVDNFDLARGAGRSGATIRRMTSEAFVRDVLTDHIERVITREQRSQRSVFFIACDRSPTDHVVHLPVDELPLDPTAEECRFVADFFAEAVTHLNVRTGMAVVLTRPGGPTVADVDRRWFRAVHESCGENGLRLIGVHLLTPGGSRELFFDDIV